jgi:hypothetical protein
VTRLGGTVRGRSVTVTASATDAGGPGEASGVRGYSFVFTHSTAPATSTPLSSLTGSYRTTLSDGVWYVHVRAVDVAGNWSSEVRSLPFRVDATAPRLVSVRVRASGSTRVTAQLRGSDAGSGVAGYTLVWNRSRRSAAGAASYAAGASPVVRSPRLARGTWYLHVRVRDQYGNWSGWWTVGPVTMPR